MGLQNRPVAITVYKLCLQVVLELMFLYLRNAFGIISISISCNSLDALSRFLAFHIYLFMIKNTIPIAELKGRVYFRTKGQTSSKMACDPCLWCSRPCVASVLCGPAFRVPQKGWHIISEARTLKRCWPPLQARVFSYSVCGLGGSLQPRKETTPQGDQ